MGSDGITKSEFRNRCAIGSTPRPHRDICSGAGWNVRAGVVLHRCLQGIGRRVS